MNRIWALAGVLLLAAVPPFAVSAQSPRADISSIAGGQLHVFDVAYSPDGTTLASGGDFGDTIKLWRTGDGSMIRTLRTKVGNSTIFGPMQPITFFPNGNTVIAMGEGASIGVWNVADGALLRTINVQGGGLALSPDATLIAVGTTNFIRLVRFSDGAVVRSIAIPGQIIHRVTFSRDGTVVAGGDRQGTLRTFRVADGAPLLAIPAHAGAINALRYSPDGALIATGGADRAINLWDSVAGKPAGTLPGHANAVNTIAFSPDGTQLASGSSDATVKLWTLATPAGVTSINQSGAVDSVSFNPIGTRLAVAAGKELREFALPSATLLRTMVRASDRISGTAFTSDSSRVVSGSWDGKISVTDVGSGALLRQIQAGGSGAAVFALAASADVIAAGINTPSVFKLFRLSDGALLRTLTPTGTQPYPRSAAFSPDGSLLVTGHFQNLARLWRVADGALLQTFGSGGFSGDVNGVAFTSDASLVLTAASDGFVQVWDTKGNLIRSMGPSGQGYKSVAVSPDNQYALAGGTAGSIQLWRVDNGALVYSFLDGGNKDVTQLRFTPSGNAFYAGRSDNSSTPGTIRLYRTSDHVLLASYSLETGVIGNNPTGPLALDVSPDGRYVSYGREDATAVLAYNSLVGAPTSAAATTGVIVKGSVEDLVLPDGKLIDAQPENGSIEIELSGHMPLSEASRLAFQVTASGIVDGVQQEIRMRDPNSGALELVDTHLLSATEQTIRVDLGPKFARFVDSAGNLSARVKWSRPEPIGDRADGPTRGWRVGLDQAIWAAGL